MIWKTNLEPEQTEFITALDGPKNQQISKVKSINKLKNATNRLESQDTTTRGKAPSPKDTPKEAQSGVADEENEIPPEV
jgi:hypothetical protein